MQMLYIADDTVAVGSDQEIKRNLQCTRIEDIFASENHIDQRSRKIPYVAVDEVTAINCIQPQWFLQKPQCNNPEDVCHNSQNQCTEETIKSLRCQVDLHRTADQAWLKNIDSQP